MAVSSIRKYELSWSESAILLAYGGDALCQISYITVQTMRKYALISQLAPIEIF
jgi:hypothetical protein